MRTRQIVTALLASSAFVSPAVMAQTITPPTTAEESVAAGAPSDDTTAPDEDIVVTGIRASQAKAIDIKRESPAFVDAISAEDIGKLPDVTIVDSLQRISGVQIQRSAGEGATVNIRGLPQVITLLNGEQYLSPGNLGSAQPNLNDIPAQLFNSVVVFKSQDVRNAVSGISGTLDLRTRRPFDLKNGLTVSAQGEWQTGKNTGANDYVTSGLISWRTDRVGFLASAGYSDLTLGNNFSGNASADYINNDWGGDGTNWVVPHGFETFHREVERKRFGASAAVQVELDDGVTFTGEGFYTRFIEHDLKAGLNISNRWQGLGFTTPGNSSPTDIIGPNGQPVINIQQYNVDAWWVKSFSVNRSIKSETKNFSGEIKYDKGGPLTFTARGVYADADYRNTNGQVEGDLSNWQKTTADGSTRHNFTLFRDPIDPTRGTFYPAAIAAQYPGQYSNGIVGANGGRYVNPNPLGYARDPQLTVGTTRNNFYYGGFDTAIGGGLGPNSTLAQYMANKDSQIVAAYSSEGNNRNKANLLAFRLDGAYDFSKADGSLFGFLKRIDFGARASRRKTEIQVYHLFSNRYGGQNATDPNGCAAQWKAIDVVLNNDQPGACRAGEQVPNPGFNPALPVSATNPQTIFQGYTAYQPTKLSTNNNVYFLSDYGNAARGLPGIWVADPRDFNDPLAFQQRVFGNAFPVIIPGLSYDVNFYEQSGYANTDLEFGPVEVNAGVKVIHTRLKVRQNLTGPTIPYGDTNTDVGDFYAGQEYWDYLPTVNAQWNVTDQLKLRAGFAKTMIPLDLGNYGGGLTINTADSPCAPSPRSPTDAPCGVRQVSGAQAAGNPNLKPWRSNNYDAAIEYYYGRASMVSVGYFRLDIDSFVTTQTLNDGRFADGDGVIRRDVPFTRPVQGNGGKIDGIEANAKVAFSDFIQSDALIRNFGIDANFTIAGSSQPKVTIAPDGTEQNAAQRDDNAFPFYDNSKYQSNLAVWYQSPALQVRVAWNRRSPRLTGQVQRIAIFQDTTNYFDANVTYSFNDNIQIFGNASNFLGEVERYYYQFDKNNKQIRNFNEFEPRYSAGARFKF